MHQFTVSLHLKPHMYGAYVLICNLPTAFLAEWLGYFTCYCSNTGAEQIPNYESAQKLDRGEEYSPSAPAATSNTFDSWVLPSATELSQLPHMMSMMQCFPSTRKMSQDIPLEFQLSRNAQNQQNSRKWMSVVGLTCLLLRRICICSTNSLAAKRLTKGKQKAWNHTLLFPLSCWE